MTPGGFDTATHPHTMEGLILTLVGTGTHQAVLPRRIHLDLRPGTGQLHIPDAPGADVSWRSSVDAAWCSALALTHRNDVDGELRVTSPNPMSGISAGLSVGLLSLACLLDRPQPPAHFATGGVLKPTSQDTQVGWLQGGNATAIKSNAAARLAPQLGLHQPIFLAPPGPTTPVPGVQLRTATDLATAYRHIDHIGYQELAARHHELLHSSASTPDPGPTAWIHPSRNAPPRTLPPHIEGIRIHAGDPRNELNPGQVLVRLEDAGRMLWAVQCANTPDLAEALPQWMDYARAAAAAPDPSSTGRDGADLA